MMRLYKIKLGPLSWSALNMNVVLLFGKLKNSDLLPIMLPTRLSHGTLRHCSLLLGMLNKKLDKELKPKPSEYTPS
jgi:hypothetical protein